MGETGSSSGVNGFFAILVENKRRTGRNKLSLPVRVRIDRDVDGGRITLTG